MNSDHKNIDQSLLVLFLLDEISEAGRFEVEVWLEQSQENRDKYEALKKTWDQTGKLEAFPREIDVDIVWNKFSEKLNIESSNETHNPQPTTRNSQPNKRTLRILYAAAAVLFFTWISITMVRFVQSGAFKPGVEIASVEEVVRDTLLDGSAIQLNLNSSLHIAKKFNMEERAVQLEGEAYFEVKSDTAKPFTIQTDLGRIRVLGTSFQVKSFPDSDLEVFVEEGRVELIENSDNGDASKIVLTAGERGIISYPDGKIRKAEAIQPDDLFWANKKLIFKETPLSLAFELLRKNYNTTIEVENDKILKCILTATFNNEQIEQILTVIALSFELEVDKSKDKFVIKGKGCGNE